METNDGGKVEYRVLGEWGEMCRTEVLSVAERFLEYETDARIQRRVVTTWEDYEA